MDLRTGLNGGLRTAGAGVPKAYVEALFARPTKTPAPNAQVGSLPAMGPREDLRPVVAEQHPLRLEAPSGSALAPSSRLSLRAKFLARQSSEVPSGGLEGALQKEAALFALLEKHISSVRDVRAALARNR